MAAQNMLLRGPFSPFSPDVREMRCLGEDSSFTGRAGWGELLGQRCFPFPP